MVEITLRELGKKLEAKLRQIEIIEPTQFYLPSVWKHGDKAQLYIRYRADCANFTTSFNRKVTEEYLAWLDAGNVGTHYQMLEEKKKRDGVRGY